MNEQISNRPQSYVVPWLWPGRIPLGMTACFAGEPGVGKSMLSLWLAAQVSRGIVPGTSDTCEPGSVLLITREDSKNRTIRPRLDSLGADIAKVHDFTIIDGDTGEESPVSLPADVEALRGKVEELGDVKLVVIDPLIDHLGGADLRTAKQASDALDPLGKLAEETGATILWTACTDPEFNPILNAPNVACWIERQPNGALSLATARFQVMPRPSTVSFRIAKGEAGPRVEWHGEGMR